MAVTSPSHDGGAAVPEPSKAARLAHALARLRGCREPAELLYRKEGPPLFSDDPSPAAAADYSVVVARRIAILVGRLSALSDPAVQAARTPRAILTALMEVVREGLAMPSGPPGEAAAEALHRRLSARAVPVEAMAEGLHNLTYASARLRLELVALRLQKRIAEELQTALATPKAEPQLSALVVTETLLKDFIAIYDNILLTLPARQLALTEQDAGVVLPSLMRYYYQLGDWVLLTAGLPEAPPITLTRITRLAWDERRGAVEVDLHRPSLDSPWGLLLNERGRLIDVDVSMRVQDRARRLHELLKSTREGAVVAVVNGAALPSPAAAEHPRRVLQALREASASRRTMRLVMRSKSLRGAARRAPVEMLFSAPDQGGEGASGQRAMLLLHRINPSAPWNFGVDDALRWHPPPLNGLSDAAKAFLRRYPRRLRLLSVNGVEVRSAAQVASLAGQESVLLELVVAPPEPATTNVKGRRNKPGERPHPNPPEHPAALAKAKRKRPPRTPKEAPPLEGVVDTPLLEGVARQDKAELVKKAKAKKGGKAGAAQVKVGSTRGEDAGRAGEKAVQSNPEDVRQEEPARAASGASDPNLSHAPTSTVGKARSKAAIQDASTTLPCPFDHGVEMISFTDEEMVLRRPSVENPWGLKIALDEHPKLITGLPMRLLALPAVAKPSDARHPFIKRFTNPPSTWFVVSINRMSVKTQGATATLAQMKSLTTMQLKLLRKLVKK